MLVESRVGIDKKGNKMLVAKMTVSQVVKAWATTSSGYYQGG